MSLSLTDADPEHPDEPSLFTRLSNIVLGDPTKAPRRIATLFVFSLFAFICVGIWMLMNARIDTSGSSAPLVGPAASILTHWAIVPVLAAWLTRRWVFFRRKQYANKAADVTGWTVQTIYQLWDEVRSTDGCTRVIASTDDTRETIAQRIDSALGGDSDDDTVDYWTPPEDGAEPTRADSRPTDVPTVDATVLQESIQRGHAAGVAVEEAVDDADVSLSQKTCSESDVDESTSLKQRLWKVVTWPFVTLWTVLTFPIRAVVSVTRWIVRWFLDAVSSGDRPETEVSTRDERDVPWKVRFLEEVKHLWLDLQSGFRTGEAAIRFGVPFGVAFTIQLFAIGLWTTLPVYALFIATSAFVGLTWYWVGKRRRQRRLRRHRTRASDEYWLDCAGQFKTVETADVTAYVGFIAGRRYAAYDRREFVRKTSETMHQHVTDECVAPSELEHYARCLAQMKPNLDGHRKNVLRSQIMHDLDELVRSSEDEIIPKAELAWLVIEQPTNSKIRTSIGYDPELVCEEYQYLVEEAHVLDEREVAFTDSSGDEQSLTIVFPADKRRLPDVSERHSQFSNRFTDKKGEPVYKLPDVDPRDSLRGLVPSPQAAARFNGATAMPNSD
ncbi:hypothetical protein [Natronosalvus halobius]|uniref:hypothetical protein n=1 Tax=Natronosalvus halobius TaxID=2953746 RepID=UPI00209CF7EC|nr:hypothetical protein [Natronosalvus halobius]USZ73785.1 hypothetical protein NGM15_18435 [Natronosalvus halobius]